MSKKIDLLIAVRGGSKRVPKKNIKPFCNSSLLEIKVKQALSINGIQNVFVSSDDNEMLEIAGDLGATPLKRNPLFATDSVPMGDVYVHLASSLESDNIMWTPVTSPLVKDETVQKCVEIYHNLEGFDSLVTTTAVNEYLWLGNNAINYDPKNHPRSQDLPDVYCLNFAINILPRHLMIKNKNILGDNFYSYMLDDVESIDVDTEFDFMIAEMLYKKMRMK